MGDRRKGRKSNRREQKDDSEEEEEEASTSTQPLSPRDEDVPRKKKGHSSIEIFEANLLSTYSNAPEYTLNPLPLELIIHIFKFLDVCSLNALSLVNKYFNVIIRKDLASHMKINLGFVCRTVRNNLYSYDIKGLHYYVQSHPPTIKDFFEVMNNKNYYMNYLQHSKRRFSSCKIDILVESMREQDIFIKYISRAEMVNVELYCSRKKTFEYSVVNTNFFNRLYLSFFNSVKKLEIDILPECVRNLPTVAMERLETLVLKGDLIDMSIGTEIFYRTPNIIKLIIASPYDNIIARIVSENYSKFFHELVENGNIKTLKIDFGIFVSFCYFCDQYVRRKQVLLGNNDFWEIKLQIKSLKLINIKLYNRIFSSLCNCFYIFSFARFLFTQRGHLREFSAFPPEHANHIEKALRCEYGEERSCLGSLFPGLIPADPFFDSKFEKRITKVSLNHANNNNNNIIVLDDD